jgi:hypothetical protein
MADANIFQQYLTSPKSVMDYTAEMDQADSRKMTLQQNALTLAAGRQKFDEGQQASQRNALVRTALMGLPQGATDDQRIQAMRGTATPEGFAAADTLSKSLAEQRKSAAAAKKDEEEASKTSLARDIALHDFHAQRLATVQTPEDALAWAQEGNVLGLFKQPGQYDRGVAVIQQAGQDPQAFAKWKAAAMQGGQSITEQLKQQLEKAKQAEQVRQFGVTEARIKSEGEADRKARDADVGFTPEAIGNAADRYNVDGTLPPMGMGKAGSAGRAAILNEAARRKAAEGVSGTDQRINQLGAKGEAQAKAASLRAYSAAGKEGQAIQAANTGLNHLETVEQLALAQKNGDTRLFNSIANRLAAATGRPAPTNLAAAITMVSPEVSKAVIGAAGGQAEREEFARNFNPDGSPEQALEGIGVIKELMGGRMTEAQRTYERTTGKKDFRATMLSPAAQRMLDKAHAASGGAAKAGAPATNAKGWALHIDAKGNKAYVSPNGQDYEEVH